MTPLQLYFIFFFIVLVIFFIIYGIKTKFKKIKELIWESFFDAITFNLGAIILLYSIGNIFDIEYLSTIDNYSLYLSLIFAGLIIMSSPIDKIIELKKRDKNEKKD